MRITTAFLCVVFAFSLNPAFAADQSQPTAGITEKWKALATPGPQHKVLEQFVGSWQTVSKFWTEPTAPPVESKGKCEQKMVLGGRYLQMECTGELLGSPFVGLGYVGYDNYRKQYVSSWMDNASTLMLYGVGNWDAASKVYTEVGDYQDPLSGTTKKYRNTIRVVDANTLAMESRSIAPDGKEVKDMEITYTRVTGK